MVELTACENNGDPVELTRRFDQMTKLRSGAGEDARASSTGRDARARFFPCSERARTRSLCFLFCWLGLAAPGFDEDLGVMLRGTQILECLGDAFDSDLAGD